MSYVLRNLALFASFSAVCLILVVFAYVSMTDQAPEVSQSQPEQATVKPSQKSQPRMRAMRAEKLTLWMDGFPDALKQSLQIEGTDSNIHRDDYAGPEACRNCHKAQYSGWSEHPHRWMNASVETARVRGDFENRRLSYLGGDVLFTKVDNSLRMRLSRGDVQKEFAVDQTIGSRYFQYYVGKQLSGPEPSGHPLYTESHVLPLGYWIDRNEWIPVVHVHDDFEDKTRHDPFLARPASEASEEFDVYAGKTRNLYRAQCNYCHTTFPLEDMLVRLPDLMGTHVPTQVDFSLPDYFRRTQPELWTSKKSSLDFTLDEYKGVMNVVKYSDAAKEAVTLGISCEACHLGSREHAEGKLKKPKFFPYAPEFGVRSTGVSHDAGRTHDNVNWACGRCHSGSRSQYASGISTWNSTEYSDAMKGSCYSQLTCTKCHNPHEAIGHQWTRSPAEDDETCLSCHSQFQSADSRKAHTHHLPESEGARCLNCHMPRINEGLQEVVRTHTIFSPTNAAMIEASQMNACNQCHVEKSIDWTLYYLREWYGASYSDEKIAASYSDRKLPAAIQWLRGNNENVRLVAADSLARRKAEWAMADLLNVLDDPFMLNRQFVRIALEPWLGIKLSSFGYEFYMTPDERKEPVQKIKDALLPSGSQASSPRKTPNTSTN